MYFSIFSAPTSDDYPEDRGPTRTLLEPQHCLKIAQQTLDLFPVRRDLFAVKWYSKDGRKGFSPECSRKWQRHMGCLLRLRKDAGEELSGACRVCTQRKYTPLDEVELYKHLNGDIVVGGYFIDASGKSWLGVLDFDDKQGTAEPDMAPIVLGARCVDAANARGMSAFLERSGGGLGAHTWLFFQDGMEPADVRDLLEGLLLDAGIDPSSSDIEIFPKQDFLSDGPGSLVALPFQGPDAIVEGRSVFLDPDTMEPITPFDAVLEEIADEPIPAAAVMEALEELRPLLKQRERQPRARERSTSSSRGNSSGQEKEPLKTGVKLIFAKCKALRDIRSKAKSKASTTKSKHLLSHDERLALAGVLRELPGGREALHSLFKRCPDYNRDKTEMHLDSLQHAPFRCETLRKWHICEEECEEIRRRRGRSPVAFAYAAKRKGSNMKGREEMYLQLQEQEEEQEREIAEALAALDGAEGGGA